MQSFFLPQTSPSNTQPRRSRLLIWAAFRAFRFNKALQQPFLQLPAKLPLVAFPATQTQAIAATLFPLQSRPRAYVTKIAFRFFAPI